MCTRDCFKSWSVGAGVPPTALATPNQPVFVTPATAPLTEPIYASASPLDDYDRTKFGVIAVGGISRSILRNLHKRLPYPFRTIAIDTDADALQRISADKKIRVCCGLVRERDPQGVRILSNAVVSEIADAVAGLDMVLLVAGMGGGAGTGKSFVLRQLVDQRQRSGKAPVVLAPQRPRVAEMEQAGVPPPSRRP